MGEQWLLNFLLPKQEAMQAVFILGLLWSFLVFVINLILAAIIAGDARQLKNAKPAIPPVLWFFIVMITSLLGVVVYWGMNHSTLSRRQD